MRTSCTRPHALPASSTTVALSSSEARIAGSGNRSDQVEGEPALEPGETGQVPQRLPQIDQVRVIADQPDRHGAGALSRVVPQPVRDAGHHPAGHTTQPVAQRFRPDEHLGDDRKLTGFAELDDDVVDPADRSVLGVDDLLVQQCEAEALVAAQCSAASTTLRFNDKPASWTPRRPAPSSANEAEGPPP